MAFLGHKVLFTQIYRPSLRMEFTASQRPKLLLLMFWRRPSVPQSTELSQRAKSGLCASFKPSCRNASLLSSFTHIHISVASPAAEAGLREAKPWFLNGSLLWEKSTHWEMFPYRSRIVNHSDRGKKTVSSSPDQTSFLNQELHSYDFKGLFRWHPDYFPTTTNLQQYTLWGTISLVFVAPFLPSFPQQEHP